MVASAKMSRSVLESAARHGIPFLGLILDASVIIAPERNVSGRKSCWCSWARYSVRSTASAVTLVELVHGVVRANTPEVRQIRRAFIHVLKKHVPVHPVTDSTVEIAGQISGEQAAKGITLPTADLLNNASAIEQGYAVATLNTRHFERSSGCGLPFRSLSRRERSRTQLRLLIQVGSDDRSNEAQFRFV